ncbi:MAG: ABC transporter substrate-binding protein [Intestinibacter sp.]|uniref:ABC transporter substrate-binding protein n=1 Tax=Intestinibacter sp. TaxID=1965304 RepID=UPI002A80C4C1|nr:ABC transporter substrate-binding protein [Intestinibacter sp.]MDY4574111.1 ABC transporter substrate-binding protein [Intestinibacter sp.]
MKLKKLIAVSSALIMALGLATGCSSNSNTSSGSNSDSSAKKSLVFADTQSPGNLNPHLDWNGWYVSRYGVGETLLKLDENLQAQPFLVDSYENTDDTTWVFKLKDGITFSNGNKVDAEAVKASLQNTIKENPRAVELYNIDSMEADGLTLTIKTKDPNPGLPCSLCEPMGIIVDVNDKENSDTNPICTGPFVVTNYKEKTQFDVAKNENYWGGDVKLDSATFKVLADTSALDMATKSNEVDVAVIMPNTILEDYKNDDNYTISSNPGSRAQMFFINHESDIMKDVNVRKAISLCIDRDNYSEVLNKGGSVSAKGLYPDYVSYAGEGNTYNVEEAKKVLKEAGYEDTDNDGILDKDGKKLSINTITYSTKAELPTFCEALKSELAEIGIELNVQIVENMTDECQNGNFDMALWSFTMLPTGDPQYFIDIAFTSDGSSNYGKYSNKEVDDLAKQLDVEFDTKKREEIASDVVKKVMDDYGYICIGHANYTYVMNKKVKNCVANPSEYYLLDANVDVEE